MATAEWLDNHPKVLAYLPKTLHEQLEEYQALVKLSMSKTIEKLLEYALSPLAQSLLPAPGETDANASTETEPAVGGDIAAVMNRVTTLEAQFQQILRRLTLVTNGDAESSATDMKQMPALESENPSGSKTLPSSGESQALEESPRLPDLPNATSLIAAAEAEAVVAAENSIQVESSSGPERPQNLEGDPRLPAMLIDYIPLAFWAQPSSVPPNPSDRVSPPEDDPVERIIWIETDSGEYKTIKCQVTRLNRLKTHETKTERSQPTPLLDPEPNIGQTDQELPQLSQFTTPDLVQTPTNLDPNVEILDPILGVEAGEAARSDESFPAKSEVNSEIIQILPEQPAQEVPQPSQSAAADQSLLLQSPTESAGPWVMLSVPEEPAMGQSNESSESDPNQGRDQAASEPANKAMMVINQIGKKLKKLW